MRAKQAARLVARALARSGHSRSVAAQCQPVTPGPIFQKLGTHPHGAVLAQALRSASHDQAQDRSNYLKVYKVKADHELRLLRLALLNARDNLHMRGIIELLADKGMQYGELTYNFATGIRDALTEHPHMVDCVRTKIGWPPTSSSTPRDDLATRLVALHTTLSEVEQDERYEPTTDDCLWLVSGGVVADEDLAILECLCVELGIPHIRRSLEQVTQDLEILSA